MDNFALLEVVSSEGLLSERLTPHQEVWVQALPSRCFLRQETLFYCLFSSWCMSRYRQRIQKVEKQGLLYSFEFV